MRQLAEHNLGAIGGNAGVCLRDFLADSDPNLRADAARELGHFPGDTSKSKAALRAALADPDSLVRAEAAGSLGVLRSHAAIPQLLTLLQDPDALPAGSAAEALAEIGEPIEEVVLALVAVLQDRTDNAGTAASRALSDLGPRAAIGVPRLVEILNAERQRLERGFRSDPATAGIPLAELWEHEDLSLAIASVLSNIGPPAEESAAELKLLLEHPHLYARLFAAHAIWSVLSNPRPTIDTAIAVLGDGENQEGETLSIAATRLCRLGASGSPALPRLRELLETTESQGVRARIDKLIDLIGHAWSPGPEDPCLDM